ncbi:MAG: amino acid permease [Solimicrobium sp.]|nr:amino acid permease [Solimicrobium sp.]
MHWYDGESGLNLEPEDHEIVKTPLPETSYLNLALFPGKLRQLFYSNLRCFMTTTLFQKLTRTKSVDYVNDNEKEDYALNRAMGLFFLTMIGVGATVGTGIFFTLAVAVPKAGPSVILSFVLASLTAGLTALCYAELAFRIPSSGSAYSFAYASLGEFAAFIVAACLLLEYGLAGSAVAIGWSEYVNNFLANAMDWHIPLVLRSPMFVLTTGGMRFYPGQFNLPPVLLVILCSFLLCRGTKESVKVNAIMVFIKLAILLFFVVIAFSGFDSNNFLPFFNADNSHNLAGMAGVTAATGTIFFSFIGLDTVATAGAEVTNPKRNVPRGILIALLIVTVFYLLVAIAAIGAQPAAKFVGQEAGLAVILHNVTGKSWPSMVLSIGTIISVFSVTLMTIYGQTRILYAIGQDALVSPIFQKINPRTFVPVKNTIIVSIVVGIIAGLVDSNFLWDMVSMGTLIAFIVVAIAVPVMRKKADKSQMEGFQIPFGPYLVPVLSVFTCLYIIKDLPNLTFRVFSLWIIASIALYFLYGISNSKLNVK